MADVCNAHRPALGGYLGAQRRSLEERITAETPAVCLGVRLPVARVGDELREAERDVHVDRVGQLGLVVRRPIARIRS